MKLKKILLLVLIVSSIIYGNDWFERTNIFGYADVVFGQNRYDSGTLGFDAYHWTTNTTIQVSQAFRLFGDVTYEHGTSHTGTNTGDLKVRYQIEGLYSDLLGIKVGKFLTPFGFQNVNHDASPTYLSVTSPRSIYWKRIIGNNIENINVKDRFFAKEGTGIWFFGSLFHRLHQFDYNFYIINGRGTSNQHKVDDNENKGAGGQLSIKYDDYITFGSSFYSEENGITNSDINSGVLSLQCEINRFQLISEYSLAQIETETEIFNLNGFYIQIAYTIYSKAILFYRFDRFNDEMKLNTEEEINTVGINYSINPKVFLKIEHGLYKEMDNVFQSQLSIAF